MSELSDEIDNILSDPDLVSGTLLSGEVWPPRAKHGDLGVLRYAERHSNHWRDRGDWYWMWRLFLEVCEAVGVMLGIHDDSLNHEIRQIGSICHNWLDKRTPETKVRMKPIKIRRDDASQ